MPASFPVVAVKRGLLVLGLILASTGAGVAIAVWVLTPRGDLPDAAARMPVAGMAEIASGTWPVDQWARVDDGEIRRLGWDPDRLAAARAMASEVGTAALMVVHRGAVIAAWGDIERIRDVRSVRKSLLGGIVGNSIGRGELALDQDLNRLLYSGTAGSRNGSEQTVLTPDERRATLAHLLTTRSGVYLPAAKETPGNARRRPARGSHAPGEFFYYNNWDYNAIGTIVERATKSGFAERFELEFARPLGMQDWDRTAQTYAGAGEHEHPAYVFRMSARDLARFGLLYARHGKWRDRQLVPEEWVSASTAPIVDRGPDNDAYGYLWWHRRATADVPEPIPYAAGANAQFMLAMPCSDMVIVHVTDSGLLLLRLALGVLTPDSEGWRVVEAVLAAAPVKGAGRCEARPAA